MGRRLGEGPKEGLQERAGHVARSEIFLDELEYSEHLWLFFGEISFLSSKNKIHKMVENPQTKCFDFY